MSVLTETVRSIRRNPHCSLAARLSSESGDICTRTVGIEPLPAPHPFSLCSTVLPQGNRLTLVQHCNADPKQGRDDLFGREATSSAFTAICRNIHLRAARRVWGAGKSVHEVAAEPDAGGSVSKGGGN